SPGSPGCGPSPRCRAGTQAGRAPSRCPDGRHSPAVPRPSRAFGWCRSTAARCPARSRPIPFQPLVEALVLGSCPTICLCPLPTWREHRPQWSFRCPDPEPLQREHDGAPRGGLLDLAADDWARERVGDQLDPFRIVEERAAGGDDFADLRQELCDGGESEPHSFERGLHEVARRRREGQAVDRAACARVPAGAALAAEEREERQAVLLGPALEYGTVCVRECPAEPRMEIAAVRERAALDD